MSRRALLQSFFLMAAAHAKSPPNETTVSKSLFGIRATSARAKELTLNLSHNNRMLVPLDSSPLRSSGTIAWICFVAVCVIATLACYLVFCLRRYHQRHQESDELRRTEEQEQAIVDVSRIEANVKVFHEIQNQRRRQTIRRTHRRNIRIVKEEDLHSASPGESHEGDASAREVLALEATQVAPSQFALELSSGCSICLEVFKAGDYAMHSKDTSVCRHVFHQNCIVSWLVTQSTSVCPCCRQEFVGEATPVSSLDSNDRFRKAMEGDIIGSSS